MVFHLIAQISEREKVTVFFSEPVAWYKMHKVSVHFYFAGLQFEQRQPERRE